MKKIHLNDTVLNCLLIFSVLTIIRGIEGFSEVNKVWMMVAAGVLVWAVFAYRVHMAEAIIYISTVILYGFAFFYTKGEVEEINIIFYFALWVLCYCFVAHHKSQLVEHFAQNKIVYDSVLIIWTVLVGISMIFPSSYNDGYFASFAGNSFQLMPSVLIIMALAMYMYLKTRRMAYNLYLIIPLFATFMGDSRTYFGTAVLFFVMYLYIIIKNKRVFYALLIPLMILVLIVAMASGIGNKVENTMYTNDSYFDFWGTITSGRSIFWVWDLNAFFGLPFLQQFVGNGFNFVYDVNGAQMDRIWAHNDIINILMNFGYIGLFIYGGAFVRLLRAFWVKGNKIPKMIKIFFICAVTLNSMFNMSYTYLCAMISYPIFLLAISAAYEQPGKIDGDMG